MKKYLENLEIECWRHVGGMGPNDPYVCPFMSKRESCEPLLLAIEEVEGTGPPAKRTVTFKPCRRAKCCSKLQVILSAESDELRNMCVSVEGNAAIIEVTRAGLGQLQEAVTAWRDGCEDFGIPTTPKRKKKQRGDLGEKDLASGELWFWGPRYYAGP